MQGFSKKYTEMLKRMLLMEAVRGRGKDDVFFSETMRKKDIEVNQWTMSKIDEFFCEGVDKNDQWLEYESE